MKLFYKKGACSLVCRIVINEIGVAASYESVDLASKITGSGENFLMINPKGAVPVLQLDSGKILTENAVILQYLADTYKVLRLLPAVGDFERYEVLEWVNYITTEVHKSFSPLFNPAISAELKSNLFIPVIEKKFAFLNDHLKDRDYLMGEHFMLPDAYLFVMLLWAMAMKIDLKQWPHLSRYLHTLQQRPSIQESLKQEAL